MRDERVGRALRAIRIRSGLRQGDLGSSAGVSQSTVSRIERGELDGVPIGVLRRVFAAAGASLVVVPSWRGGELDRLFDERHALLSGAVLERLRRHGWTVLPEVSFSHYGERGSIDLLAGHPPTRTGLTVEVKTEVTSLEQLQRRLDIKMRLSGGLVHERFGWRPVVRARLLALPEGRATRNQLERHATLLAAAFPDRGWRVRQWLHEPAGYLSGLWVLSSKHAAGATRLSPDPQRVRVRSTRSEERGAGLPGAPDAA